MYEDACHVGDEQQPMKAPRRPQDVLQFWDSDEHFSPFQRVSQGILNGSKAIGCTIEGVFAKMAAAYCHYFAFKRLSACTWFSKTVVLCTSTHSDCMAECMRLDKLHVQFRQNQLKS
jgi:hypothetical protein